MNKHETIDESIEAFEAYYVYDKIDMLVLFLERHPKLFRFTEGLCYIIDGLSMVITLGFYETTIWNSYYVWNEDKLIKIEKKQKRLASS